VALVRSSERDDSKGMLGMDIKDRILDRTNTYTKEMILCCIKILAWCSVVVIFFWGGGSRTSIIV
jgi:hypothetical protein